MPKEVSGRVVKTRMRCSEPDDLKVELGPLGPADPVALHDLDPLGPVEGVQVVEELVGVVGDLEEPLLEVALDDDVARAVTGAVGVDLLVGQHGLAARAPVDRRLLAVGQARLQEAQEDPLGPADVLGVVAAHLPPPVVDRAQPLDGLLQLGDAGIGERPGVDAGLDGRVLRRQAEGVEPHRAEDGVAVHRPVADDEVAEGVVPHVALVGRPAGVGVHAEGVEGRARVVGLDLVGALVPPPGLPLLLYLLDVVGLGHARTVTGPEGLPAVVSSSGAGL